jgi:hypothetical protein
VDSAEPRYTGPLKAGAEALLAEGISSVVLLGSIATGKYLDTLRPILGERLCFPLEFKGRGDMSRGALLLRCVTAKQELEYAPVTSVLVARPNRKQRVLEPRNIS